MPQIELWSDIELRIFSMVSQCLKAEPIIATAMLQAVDNQAAQRAAILAAAKSVLDDEHGSLFEAAFFSTFASRNVRHQFVHHLWGISDQLPDALLMEDPKYFHMNMAKRLKRVDERIKKGVHPVLAGEFLVERTGMYVWRERDIKDEINNALRAQKIMAHLASMVGAQQAHRSTDSMRKWLLKDPLIQQRLQKASKKI